MPVGWVITVVTLSAAVVILAVILLGVLRQVTPVLERAAAILVPDDQVTVPGSLRIGPAVGSRLPLLPLPGGGDIRDRLPSHHAVLLFLTPGCGPCGVLAKDMNQADFGSLDSQLVIITTPDGPQELGIPAGVPILTEQDREISDTLSVTATPFAIAVDHDRIIRAARVPHTMKEITDLASVIA